MSAMSRREFFKKTATDAAVAGFLAAAASRRANANPLGLPIGSQTYPHRERIVKGDFAGLLKDMKGPRHRGHRAVQSGVQGVLEPVRRQTDQEDPRRQRDEVPERPFHDGLAAQDPGTADRVGAGARHDHDEHGDPQRPSDQRHDDARGSEAGRRRVQQDRGAGRRRPACSRSCTTRDSRTPGSRTGGSPTPS